MATDAEGKKLSDLRVVDLRAELEKRGLDKTGVKAALLERLQKALLSEGKDPDEYEFELNDKKPVKRLSTSNRTEEVDNSAETSANDSNVLMIETPSLEQEADKDGAHEEETKNNEKADKSDIANAESPLNISIGEEEELYNSGDEHDQSANSLQKDEDEKTAANQSNVDDTKKSDSSSLKPDDDKEDGHNDTAHNQHADSADNHDDDDDDDDNNGNNKKDGNNGGSTDAKKNVVAAVGNCDAAAATTTATSSSSSSSTTTTAATSTGATASSSSSSGQTTAPPPASSNGATVASDKECSKSDKDADKNKDKDKNNKGNPGRSLWVTNLLPSTRAQELKHLLSKYGKVIGAKVVQSSRYPRQRCYGYVTMETRAAADLCIEKLTNTELKGQIIRVAKVRPEHSLPVPMNKPPKKEDSVEKDKRKKSPPKSSSTKSDRKSPEKKKEASDSTEKKKDETTKKDVAAAASKDGKEERDRSRKSSRESNSRKRSLTKTSSSTRVERKSDILTFDKIREERERQRQRERERAMREEEKRRREIARAREIEKRQREEALRLEREREKLRMERDRLDRQRAEIMRLERERQRLEREKLEQERQELRRAQMKLEEARRPVKRPSSTTTANYRRETGGGGAYSDERKRMVTDRHYDETPPPPRFEVTNRDSAPDISKSKELPKDYKSRLAYSSKRAEEYPPKRSSGSDFKREYPPADRHSGGHPSHLVHSIGNNASSSKYESSSYVNREREREIREPTRRETIVPNVPPPRISKDARYAERTGERSPVSYRAVRDERERRQVSDHHSSKGEIRSSRDHRYPEPSMKEGARYREGGNSWHSAPVKPFSNIGGGGGGGSAASSRDSWNKTDTWRPMETNTNERWGNSSSRMLMSGTSGVPNSIFSGGSSTLGISAGLSCPPPPGNSSYPMDRFESSFKSLNSSRKY